MMESIAKRAAAYLKRVVRRDPAGLELLFDADWYRKRYADVAAANEDPLIHFIRYGSHEGRDPNPLFDADWYRAHHQRSTNTDLLSLSHFMTIGVRERYDPHPLFSTSWFLVNNPRGRAAHLNPLADFLMNGLSNQLEPHPLFNTAWYLHEYPDVKSDNINPLVHYLETGASRGYNPNPYFDSSWYLARYPDVALTKVNPLRHYVEFGAKEGRDPSLRFETDWYRRQNMLADENPLEHFLTIGLNSGREPLSRMGIRRIAAIGAARRGFAGLAACDPELMSWIDESMIPALPSRANLATGPTFSAWKALLTIQKLYDRMIVIGTLADLPRDGVAATALRLAHEAEGVDSVLLILTDDNRPIDRSMIPEGTHVRSLGEIDPNLLEDHRTEIMQKAIYHLQPRCVLNCRSRALWRAMATFGGPLSVNSKLFAFLDYPAEDERQLEFLRYLRPSHVHLIQLFFKSPENLRAASADFGLSASEREHFAISFPQVTSATEAETKGRASPFLRSWLMRTHSDKLHGHL